MLTWFQKRLRACLPGAGGPQVGGVTRLYIQSLIYRLHDRWGDHMRDYIDRRVTPPKRFTSPTWGPHLHVNRP